MLKGASCFIRREPKPVWMVEVCIREHQPEGVGVNPHLLEIFNRFWELGYESWAVLDDPRKVTSAEISEIVATGVDTLATHNFLFAGCGLV